ncbi:hypothetical protein VP01_76g4 [Puccinia sorghi]|uniref:Uncharacterized protein n=1 Tax=Puccinia sorghi TaxID=27349 RepID=A0A0L6UBM5_9BASI|nr:hypothetical protein VP01_76g4 [Puccinia sorghi]
MDNYPELRWDSPVAMCLADSITNLSNPSGNQKSYSDISGGLMIDDKIHGKPAFDKTKELEHEDHIRLLKRNTHPGNSTLHYLLKTCRNQSKLCYGQIVQIFSVRYQHKIDGPCITETWLDTASFDELSSSDQKLNRLINWLKTHTLYLVELWVSRFQSTSSLMYQITCK